MKMTPEDFERMRLYDPLRDLLAAFPNTLYMQAFRLHPKMLSLRGRLSPLLMYPASPRIECEVSWTTNADEIAMTALRDIAFPAAKPGYYCVLGFANITDSVKQASFYLGPIEVAEGDLFELKGGAPNA